MQSSTYCFRCDSLLRQINSKECILRSGTPGIHAWSERIEHGIGDGHSASLVSQINHKTGDFAVTALSWTAFLHQDKTAARASSTSTGNTC